jgi:hypothetical protein
MVTFLGLDLVVELQIYRGRSFLSTYCDFKKALAIALTLLSGNFISPYNSSLVDVTAIT